ncbi:hypothetical protein D3C85_1446880 [compost metagenome]
MGFALAHGELAEGFLALGHLRQHLCRRRQGRVVDLGLLRNERLGVFFAAMALVEQLRQRRDFFQQFAGPLLEFDRLALAL